jgi:hypothetical protein
VNEVLDIKYSEGWRAASHTLCEYGACKYELSIIFERIEKEQNERK